MPTTAKIAAFVVFLLLVWSAAGWADGSGDPTAVKEENGRWLDRDGVPTYKIDKNGTVDWATYSGFRRYHADCHTCHGPDGEGSSYAPSLKNSLKTMSYTDFVNIVVNGRKNVSAAQELVMPSFANDANVMCYLDDIYVYLRARANDAIARGRPAKHEPKSKAVSDMETSCMGQK